MTNKILIILILGLLATGAFTVSALRAADIDPRVIKDFQTVGKALQWHDGSILALGKRVTELESLLKVTPAQVNENPKRAPGGFIP